MTFGPIYAPYSQTYAQREAYLTAAEYINSPTGVTVSDLSPGAGLVVNSDALAQTLLRASSWVDSICGQILAATMETQTGTYRVHDGRAQIKLNQFPIVAIYSVALGSNPLDMAPLTTDPGIEIDKQVIRVPVPRSSGHVRAAVSYVAGFANSLLTAAVAVGATVLLVDNSLGVVPGMSLTINDPGASEVVTVLAVSTNSITVAAPIRFAHAIAVNVSALPAGVKQATVLLTTALIKTRASEAFVFNSVRATPGQKQAAAPGAEDELETATMLVNEWIRRI